MQFTLFFHRSPPMNKNKKYNTIYIINTNKNVYSHRAKFHSLHARTIRSICIYIYTHIHICIYIYITWYKLSEDDGNRKEEERKKKKIKKSRSIGGATRKDAWQRALRKSAVVDSLTD